MKKNMILSEQEKRRILSMHQSAIKNNFINEGIFIPSPESWEEIQNVVKGDTMRFESDNTIVHLKGGKPFGGQGDSGMFNNYRIIENPNQSDTKSGTKNVVSFDPNTKYVTFEDGIVVGPA